MAAFLGEIKRRKVFQVAAVYAIVAWLLVQIVATVEEPLSLPQWADTLVILLLAVGFPITLVISWAFNVTSEGLVRDSGGGIADRHDGRAIEYVLIGLLAVAVFLRGKPARGAAQSPRQAAQSQRHRQDLRPSVLRCQRLASADPADRQGASRRIGHGVQHRLR